MEDTDDTKLKVYLLRHTNEDIEETLKELGIEEFPRSLKECESKIIGDFIYSWFNIYYKTSSLLKFNEDVSKVIDCGDDEMKFIRGIIESREVNVHTETY